MTNLQVDTESWIVAWFAGRGVANPDAGANFVSCGWIDSFGVIELIEAAESQFSLTFKQEHFQDLRFSTIRGLAELIAEIKTGIAA